ncbi:MAG: protein translocase subunit SecD [Acidimicrobiia bacterium]|nr:protein translocase subunit SecD [Acidimicrobiia bacterium]
MNRRPLWISLILVLTLAWGSLAAMLAAGWEPKLGLDLQGGFSVVLAAPEGTDREVLDQAVETMRRRIESLGAVQEPEISVQGDRRILVQLPGVEDRERALAAVGTTGQLTFRPVYDIQAISPAFLDGTLPLPESLTTTTGGPGEETTTTTQPPVIPVGIDPVTGLSLFDDPQINVYLQDDSGFYYALGPAFLTGADLTGAEPGFGGVQVGGGGGWTVDPSFTADGGRKFEDATGILSTFTYGDPRRQMAIVLDGTVISAPSIAAEVAPGETLPADTVVITIGASDNSQAEAEDLATVLKYGALPTTFERESEGSVSASLGSDSLRAGLLAGFAGLILVALALVAYYRVLGLIAVIGFTVFGSLLIGTIIFLGQAQGTTLTLSGVTGIIVSIGITADSYIVFFERIKEEHRRGRALKPAVDYGFKRAFHTIVTADTVTLAGSILLWLLAIGPVKGFALTLGIATVIDVFVAYFFTRPFAQLLVRSRLGEGGALSIRGAMGRAASEGVAA